MSFRARFTLIVVAVLFAWPTTVWASAPTCDAIAKSYSADQASEKALADLFEDPFNFSELSPAFPGDPKRQAQFEIKNLSGFLDCDLEGAFRHLELCAELGFSDEDPYLLSRFAMVANHLASAVLLTKADDILHGLMVDAIDDLEAKRIRGEEAVSGDALTVIDGKIEVSFQAVAAGATQPMYCITLSSLAAFAD